MNREVKERIKSILSVLIFLTVTTWYWYGPREDLAYIAANTYKYNRDVEVLSKDTLNLNDDEYKFKIYNKTNQVKNYEIIVANDYFAQRKENCKLLSNNYLKYQLKLDNVYQESRNLSSDGIIYRGQLEPNESKNFIVKMKVDKTNLSSDECFFPAIKTATYNTV